jgi:hypothetical protein
MPSARELLQQADALMRRNRRREWSRDSGDTTPSGDDAALTGPSRDVPTLTDALAVDAGASLLPTVMLPQRAADADADADPISIDTLSDLPVLTDAVDIDQIHDFPRAAAPEIEPEPLFPEEASARERIGPEVAVPDAASPEADASERADGGATVADATVPPPSAFVDADFILEIPPPEGALPAEVGEDRARAMEAEGEEMPASDEALAPGDLDWGSGPDRDQEETAAAPADAPAAAPAPEVLPSTPPAAGPEIERASPDWDALADEIRAQVMQRLDLFTDTGLREQLGARLQPIVQRASTELVETINRQVGELVRSYVAEAIEREIDSWRSRHP